MKAGFVYDLPELKVSVKSISEKVPDDSVTQAAFRISASDGSIVRGEVLCDSQRVTFAESTFEGKLCEIVVWLHTKGLGSGSSFDTEILIRSNLTEQALPVHVETLELAASSRKSRVRTLDDFLKTCQKSLREGFRLFTEPDFVNILNGKNRQYLSLYRGMSKNPVTYQHLEEFLVSTGKKEPIEITLDRQEKAVYHLDVSQKDTLYVYRNTWGYVRLEVEVEGDFLEVEKRVITTEDFIGKVYGLEYIVHSDRIGEGKAFGRIRIRSVHQTIEYQIEASRREESQITPATVRNRRISWLMKDYLDLQLHKLDYRSWQESASMTIHEMLEEDSQDVWAILYEAYMEQTRENTKRALEILWPLKDGTIPFEDEEQKAFYLSIAKAVGLLPEEKNNIVGALRRYLQRNPSSYLILKLIHGETPDLRAADKMADYEACYRAGCVSPFLYLDAWQLFSGEEALLRRLSSFVVHVLNFGMKYGTVSEGLLLRTAFLSANLKRFNGALFRLLSAGYRQYRNDELLEAVCKLIIKGEPVRSEYFEWYERAVARDIRVTRLYEYYMETYHKEAESELPEPIKMYFATNTALGESKRALLYASIVLHRGSDETSYMNYARTMRSFSYDALQRGRIDRNYAILYEHFFGKPENAEIAGLMANVIFAHKVTVKDPAIRRVIVSHNALKEEESALVVDGIAYPRIYTEDACILLEDSSRRRFATTIPYSCEKMFRDNRNIAKLCMDFGVNHAGTQLAVCHEKAFQMEVNSSSIFAYRIIVRDKEFTDDYRRIVRRKLMEYDLAHEESGTLPDFMPKAEIPEYAEADKASTIILLARESRYADACMTAFDFGYEGVPAGLLLKICNRVIMDSLDEIDAEKLVHLAWHIFVKGKYDEVILCYLRDHYDGSVRNLTKLWNALNGFQLDSAAVAEKIMLQSIRTHQFPEKETELIRLYIRQNGRQRVVNAFLSYLAEYYFLGGRQIPGQVFILIEGCLQRKEMDYTVCKLALLKYYSEIGALNHVRMEMCREILKEMDAKGCRFEFYKKLPAQLIQAYQIEDKVFVQEQHTPGTRVVIHYSLTGSDGEEGEWISEPVRDVYHGIFVKEFLLFYGETLTYYLSYSRNGKKENTDSYQISLVDMDSSGNTRYKLINRMLESRDNQDQAGFDRAMEQYQEQDAFVEQLLHLSR